MLKHRHFNFQPQNRCPKLIKELQCDRELLRELPEQYLFQNQNKAKQRTITDVFILFHTLTRVV